MNQNASSIAMLPGMSEVAMFYVTIQKKMLMQKYRSSKLYNISGNNITNIVYRYNQKLTNNNI
jgi:hypothetical protein